MLTKAYFIQDGGNIFVAIYNLSQVIYRYSSFRF